MDVKKHAENAYWNNIEKTVNGDHKVNHLFCQTL